MTIAPIHAALHTYFTTHPLKPPFPHPTYSSASRAPLAPSHGVMSDRIGNSRCARKRIRNLP